MNATDQVTNRILAQELAKATLTAEALNRVRLYAENQGDKFHPLSDIILANIETHKPSESDEAGAGGNAALHRNLDSILSAYEGDPENAHLFYHIGRLREALTLGDGED